MGGIDKLFAAADGIIPRFQKFRMIKTAQS